MTRFRSSEILGALGGEAIHAPRGEASGISTDSRSIARGELFVALAGKRYDGHDHLGASLERGAWGAILSRRGWEGRKVREAARAFPEAGIFLVDDTERALGDLAAFHRRRLGVKVVGVTGSNGKSTTKEMIASVAAQRCRVHRNAGNLNNLVGLPLSVFGLEEEHEVAVLEMGMNRPGEIRRLAAIAAPEIAVVTNVGPAHLEGLGSLEGVFAAKAEILEALPPAGRAIVPAEGPFAAELAAAADCPVTTFGLGRKADFLAEEIVPRAGGGEFLLHSPPGRRRIRILFEGEHNVRNALAAAAAAWALGLSLDDIVAGLGRAEGLAMRFRRIALPGDVEVVDDSYNANPASMGAALRTFAGLRGRRRRLAVLGDMLELGDEAPRAHRELGREAASSGMDLLVAVGAYRGEILKGAREGGMAPSALGPAVDWAEAAELLRPQLRPGDVVLLKASRGVGLERVIESLRSAGEGGG